MKDPNIVFTLRAHSDYARKIFPNRHNERYYVRPPPVTAATSRESSVATNIGGEDCEDDGDKEFLGQRLRFTFDKRPKNIQDGWVFGSNPKICDVFIGSSKGGTSGSHFRITFDDKGRLVLIDSSTHGTAVSYDGQARDEKRKNPSDRKRNKPRDKSNDFTWILFSEVKNKRVTIGHKIKELSNAPVIEFWVDDVMDSEAGSCPEHYKVLRDMYLAEMQTAIPFGLNIDSHSTTAGQTGSHTPIQHAKQRSIWIDREEIGSGQYGTVYRTVNVSTGVTYAAKLFLRKGRDHRERWDREVALLRNISHDHIVKFEDYDTERNWPRLIMEYLPLGSLLEHTSINEWETVTLLCQGLDALKYLHSHKITHRDLKPANILVQCRETAKFCIKIADFGLAQDGSFLETFCGTKVYAAPEIWLNRPYTSKVDIWSLGLIAFEFTYRFPVASNTEDFFDHKRWYKTLMQTVDDWESDGLLDFLKSSMLTMDPRSRLTASECLKESAKLLEAIVPAQKLELDPGSPTEPMSSASMLQALQATEMAAKRAEASFDFPTLSTIKSGRQPREYPEINTQIWDAAPDNNDVPEEGEQSQEHAESRVGNNSSVPLPKRRRLGKPDEDSLMNQQMPWKRHEDQILMEQPESGCMQMVLNRKAVSMRTSDWWLNATQLIRLAGKTKNEKVHIMRTLKRHTNVETLARNSWISYSDGLHLCEVLQLRDALQPLLNYAQEGGARPDNSLNYFQPFYLQPFLQVIVGEIRVFIRREDLWINATHIVKVGGFDRALEIPKIRARRAFIYIRGGVAKGTYVEPSFGLQLCQEYRLDGLRSNLRSTLIEHGYQPGDSSQLADTTSGIPTMETDATEMPGSVAQKSKTGLSVDQGVSHTDVAPRLDITDMARLSWVSCFPEVENGSFLPQVIHEPQLQAVHPNLRPPSTSSTYMHSLQ